VESKDVRTMETFADRLKQAALYRRIEYRSAAIGRSLGLARQTVHRWLKGGEPSPEHIYLIADRWSVDARWLATGEGYMTPPPSDAGLTRQELDLIAAYRQAHPEGKTSMRAIAKAITKSAMIALLAVGVSTPETSYASISAKCGYAVYYVKSVIRRLRQRFALSNQGI
jgi:transcriptional regulator with XRE-family HTH domain